MRMLTRVAHLLIYFTIVMLIGCNGGSDGVTPPPPVNEPPAVTITSSTPDSIFYNETIEFTWQGDDPDGNLSGYYAGLDGNLQFTTQTSASYSGFTMGDSHVFSVYAEDDEGLTSNTATAEFNIYPYAITLDAYGEGVTDDDGDGFWSQFNVRWSSLVLTDAPEDIYLRVSVRPTYGSGAEFVDSSNVITRNPGDDDTLTYTLPTFTKNLYDIKVELLDESATLLQEIDYGAVASLTEIGLEQFDDSFAWFDDAWTDNAIDDNGDDYYESIDLWWDADAYPDPVWVKVVVYERNSADEERLLWEHFAYEVNGLGNEDANGITVTAGTTFDEYDYRLELRDLDNQLIDFLDYGADPDLLDIPLGNTGSSHGQSRAHNLNR